MTKKHKLKKRVRSRMETEGTTYTEALAKEQEAKTVAPKWTIASLRELHGNDGVYEVLTELVGGEQQLLCDNASEDRVNAFVARLCELAVEIHTESVEWTRDSLTRVLMEAAVGIDRFWLHDPGRNVAPERWRLWSDVLALLKTEASREELRTRIETGVLCGLAATDIYGSIPETHLRLIEEESEELGSLWDSAPDTWEVFGGRPSTYSGGGPTDEPQDAVVVGAFFEVPRRVFVGTDEGIAAATAELQSRMPRVEQHFDVEAFKQQKVSQLLGEQIEKILSYRKIGKRRAIVEELVSIDDAGLSSLEFVNEVFAKIVGDETEEALRVQLASLLEPKIRTLLRTPATTG